MALEALYGDRLLVSVFAQYKAKSKFRVSDSHCIVAAFYKALKSGKYNTIFTNYPFDEDGLAPTSSELEDGISSLQQARLIGRMNPDLKDYVLNEALKTRYRTYIEPELKPEEKDLVQRLSTDIKASLQIVEE